MALIHRVLFLIYTYLISIIANSYALCIGVGDTEFIYSFSMSCLQDEEIIFFPNQKKQCVQCPRKISKDCCHGNNNENRKRVCVIH